MHVFGINVYIFQVWESVQISFVLVSYCGVMWPRAELLHTSEWREVVWVQLSKAHPWHSWQELYVGCCGWHSQEAQKCGTLSGHHHQIQAWVPPWHWDYSHSDTPFMERKITSHLLWRSQKGILVYLIVWKKKFIRQSREETFILVRELKNQMSEIYYFLFLTFFFFFFGLGSTCSSHSM